MRTMLRIMAVAVAVAGIIGNGGGPARAGEPLVLVELFTSQGCSSCPPADRAVAQLAGRAGVLVLSFHVDYWNYIGWKDPYSSAAATSRQKSYRGALHRSFVYTPQIVIDGEEEIAGSALDSLPARVEAARAHRKIEVAVQRTGDGMAEVRIPASARPRPPADVWVAIYDRKHVTRVAAGENRGRSLTNANVVRSFQRLGVWRGQAITLTLPLTALGGGGRDSCAIIVQEQGPGPVLGAATIGLASNSR